MDEDRERRYRDKRALILRRLVNLREWAPGGDFSADEKTRLAVFKALQEVVEAALDLCAMSLTDAGKAAHDDYHNVDTLKADGLLDAETASLLKEANGLRNRLIHQYNRLEEGRVTRFLHERLNAFGGFLAAVDRWLTSMP